MGSPRAPSRLNSGLQLQLRSSSFVLELPEGFAASPSTLPPSVRSRAGDSFAGPRGVAERQRGPALYTPANQRLAAQQQGQPPLLRLDLRQQGPPGAAAPRQPRSTTPAGGQGGHGPSSLQDRPAKQEVAPVVARLEDADMLPPEGRRRPSLSASDTDSLVEPSAGLDDSVDAGAAVDAAVSPFFVVFSFIPNALPTAKGCMVQTD